MFFQSKKKKILKDLLLLDPELKTRVKELEKIISEIIISRPETKFDKNFIKELKDQIMAVAPAPSSPIINFINMKKAYYFAGALAIVVLISVPLAYQFFKSGGELAGPIPDNGAEENIFVSEIKKVEPRSFGSLAFASQTSAGTMKGGAATAVSSDIKTVSAVSPVAMGLGGGGGAAGGIAIREGEYYPMPPYEEPISYRFVYGGEIPDITESEMPVYMRIKDGRLASRFFSELADMNLGLIDLGSFTDSVIQNLSLAEDREYGHTIFINFIDNLISIDQNWEKWPRPENNCQEEKCFADLRLKEEDIPADEEIIAIANDFAVKYGINLDSYGPAEVDNTWRLYYNQTVNKADFYFPDIVSVLYPLLIDGQIVYEESGNKTGLRVNVSVRERLATGVYGLSGQQYESSNYEIIKEKEKILSLVEKGGWGRRFGYYSDAGKVIDIELGAPALSLVNIWQYDGAESRELAMPALVFPVVKIPEGAYVYERNIIVPLVSEMWGQVGRGAGGVIEPMPMPLITTPAAEGSAPAEGR